MENDLSNFIGGYRQSRNPRLELHDHQAISVIENNIEAMRGNRRVEPVLMAVTTKAQRDFAF